MAYVTLGQLRSIPIQLEKSAALLREARANVLAEVFLSHSHLDDQDLARVVTLLEQSGVQVRLDQTETLLFGLSGTEAAPIIRDSIQSCPKLVVALTKHIVGSRWIPWEIGLADGLHGINNVALFPLLAPSVKDVPVEKEYLDLYPAIEWVKLNNQPTTQYCVRVPGTQTYWTLQQWLKMRE